MSISLWYNYINQNKGDILCTQNEIDYGYISGIVSDYTQDEFKEIRDMLTVLAMLQFKTAGYTNVFKKNPKDNRKHIAKNVKDIADVFGIEFKV